MYDRCQYCHQGYIIGGLAACASWHQVGFAKTSLLYAVPLVCDWTPFRGEQVMCPHRLAGMPRSSTGPGHAARWQGESGDPVRPMPHTCGLLVDADNPGQSCLVIITGLVKRIYYML